MDQHGRNEWSKWLTTVAFWSESNRNNNWTWNLIRIFICCLSSWRPSDDTHDRYKKLYNFIEYQDFPQFEEEINPSNLQFKCSGWEQFTVLFRRLSKQMYRNKVKYVAAANEHHSSKQILQNYLSIRFFMHIFLGFVVGGLFYQMGNDATKTLFNFGFCFTIIIAFLYVSKKRGLILLPSRTRVLSDGTKFVNCFKNYRSQWCQCFSNVSRIVKVIFFRSFKKCAYTTRFNFFCEKFITKQIFLVPLQIEHLKREHFNRWWVVKF